MTREWTIENISAQFVSVKVRDTAGNISRAVGFPPQSRKSVRSLFRLPDGSPDVDAAKSNEDVKQHIEQGRMKLYEREYQAKVPNTGPLFNETDPEETRVQKVLEYRKRLKAGQTGAPAHEPTKRTKKE